MKTITYNPETHVLVPREPGLDITEPGWEAVDWEDIRSPSQLYLVWKAMLAAAPQPEQVDVGSVGWKHDCAALCANDIELWIDRCPHCGKPRHKLHTSAQPDRTAELESALKVARDALNDCEGALDECRDYPITYDTILEALAKINEVLYD